MYQYKNKHLFPCVQSSSFAPVVKVNTREVIKGVSTQTILLIGLSKIGETLVDGTKFAKQTVKVISVISAVFAYFRLVCFRVSISTKLICIFLLLVHLIGWQEQPSARLL